MKKNKETITSFFLLSVYISMVLLGSIVGKLASKEIHGDIDFNDFINVYFILGYFNLFISGFIWIFVLRKLDLSYAYPMISSTYVLMPPLSYMLFSESIDVYNIIGSFVIFAGLMIINLDSK